MGSKKIYLIRHGQTDYNLRGIVQGSGVDASLNNRGVRQAAAFYQAYKSVPFDKAYTSTLKRSIESIKGFINHGLAVENLDGLNEISWGVKEGKPITPDEDKYYHWMLQQWREGRTDLRIERGESPDEVAARQRVVLNHILQKENEETVLICMHGRAMRILICQMLQQPLKNMDFYEHQNLCLYQIQYDGYSFQIEKNNDVRHLLDVDEKISEQI